MAASSDQEQPGSLAARPFNQPPPFENIDLFRMDRPLQDAVVAFSGGDAGGELSAFGRRWGAEGMMSLGFAANTHPPELERFDPRGFRRDVVEFHMAYHALMRESMAAGLHASTWTTKGQPAAAPAQVTRAAKFYMAAQIEGGHLCPITMTRASVAALVEDGQLLHDWMPKIASTDYDSRFLPAAQKRSVTLGMGMTERQGGTDVRTNETRATRKAEGFRINGEKWFMSAPMCDAFLVLAQAEEGLTCFLMPRFTPDGEVNRLRFERLKDKLGNRSNASSEVVFDNAFAWRVGEPGKGIRTILQMVQLTRLDCAISSAGMMRMGLAQALHHCRHRIVFQRHLVAQPMMQNVLADLALTVEAATALVFRLCRAFDLAAGDPLEAAWMRIMTPVAKYWICKTAPAFLYEAMECLGGNGYVESGVLARLYREAPVNAIWEGSGNVMCLDVLRAIAREGEAVRTLLGSLGEAVAIYPKATELLLATARHVMSPQAESGARASVEALARVAALASLTKTAPDCADIFAAKALHGTRMWGAQTFDSLQLQRLLERALPH